MSVADHCRAAVTVAPGDTLRAAAQRMQEHNVGSLVVTEQDRAVGILTDRDLALRVLAQKLDAGAVKVWEVMHRPLVSVPEETPLLEAMRVLRKHGLRRLPVLASGGALVGVVTLDDLLRLVSTQLGTLAQAVSAQLGARDTAKGQRTEGR